MARIARRSSPVRAHSPGLRTWNWLIEGKRVQRLVHGDEHVLVAVERVRFGRIRDRADPRIPQRFPRGRVKRDEVAAAVAREDEMTGRREKAAATAARIRVTPRDLAGLVVDCREEIPGRPDG